MKRLTDNKIILVQRKTRLQELIARYNTFEQVDFYLKSLGDCSKEYVEEDKTYNKSVKEADTLLSTFGRVQHLQREYLSNFIFAPNDIIVVLGQDGLVANTLKYLSGQPLIGVNPDNKRYDGILLPFLVKDLTKVVPEVFQQKRLLSEVSMAKATLQDGQVLYAVNDLFVGPKSHVSARYTLEINGKREEQSSSGVIISTGLGATGWLKSIIAGTTGILQEISGSKFNLKVSQLPNRNDNFLQFTVREPFPSTTSQASIVFGSIAHNQQLLITSKMPQNGVIFSDGIESDFLEFCSGSKATISVAEKCGQLVV